MNAEHKVTPRPPNKLASSQRFGLVGLGGTLLVLLGTARGLEPATEGFGTHRGLGLPPCRVVAWLDVRCPSCGMTTSWAYLTRGRVLAALTSNTGGTLLALLAMAIAPWAIVSAIRGKALGGIPGSHTVLIGFGVVILVTLIDWAFRLFV